MTTLPNGTPGFYPCRHSARNYIPVGITVPAGITATTGIHTTIDICATIGIRISSIIRKGNESLRGQQVEYHFIRACLVDSRGSQVAPAVQILFAADAGFFYNAPLDDVRRIAFHKAVDPPGTSDQADLPKIQGQERPLFAAVQLVLLEHP